MVVPTNQFCMVKQLVQVDYSSLLKAQTEVGYPMIKEIIETEVSKFSGRFEELVKFVL